MISSGIYDKKTMKIELHKQMEDLNRKEVVGYAMIIKGKSKT